MTEYYEAHITILEDRPRKLIQDAVEQIKWKFSAIDGDPVLGKRVYCYATKHYPLRIGKDIAVQDLLIAARRLGLNVVRRKIEQVIFDDRFGDCATCPKGVINA